MLQLWLPSFIVNPFVLVGMVPVYRVALQCCGQGAVGIIYFSFLSGNFKLEWHSILLLLKGGL